MFDILSIINEYSLVVPSSAVTVIVYVLLFWVNCKFSVSLLDSPFSNIPTFAFSSSVSTFTLTLSVLPITLVLYSPASFFSIMFPSTFTILKFVLSLISSISSTYSCVVFPSWAITSIFTDVFSPDLEIVDVANAKLLSPFSILTFASESSATAFSW